MTIIAREANKATPWAAHRVRYAAPHSAHSVCQMYARGLFERATSLDPPAKLFAVRSVAAVCAIALGNLMEYLLRFCLPSARCEIK